MQLDEREAPPRQPAYATAHPGRHGDHHQGRIEQARVPPAGTGHFAPAGRRTYRPPTAPAVQQRFQRLAKRADRRVTAACYTGSRAPIEASACPSRCSSSPGRRSLRRRRGCKDEAKNDRASAAPAPAGASSAHADVCAGGGGQDTDAISAPFVPRARRRLLHRSADRAEDLRRQGQAHDGRGVHHRVRRRVRGVQALRARSRRRAPVRRRQRRAQQRRGEPLALHDGRRRVRHVHQARRRRRRSGQGHRQAARGRRRGRDEQQQRLRLARAVPRRAHVRDRGHEDDAAGDGRRPTSRRRAPSPRTSARKLPGLDRPAPRGGRAARPRRASRWASRTTRRTRSALTAHRPAGRRATTRTATSAGATSPSCAPTPTTRRRRSARSSCGRARSR